MKSCVILVVCFLADCVFAQERKDSQTDLADRVYKWVGDSGADRDSIVKVGFAVLIDGISVQPETALLDDSDDQLKLTVVDVPEESQFQRLYVRKGNGFDYRAFNQISLATIGSDSSEQQVHHWLEFLIAGAITRGREFPFNPSDRRAPPYTDRPDDVSVGEWFIQKFTRTRGLAPYDSFVIPYSFLLSYGMHPESVERTLLQRYQLVSVTPKLGGQYVSEWTRTLNGGELQLSIKHDPNKNWMPTDVRLRSGKGWPKTVKVDQHMRLLRWEKVDQFWLPHLIDCSHDIGGSDRHVREVVKLRWAIGKKVPVSAFDPQTDDLRQPILDHFGVEYRRIDQGKIMSTPTLDPPPELLEEFQSNTSK